MLKVTNSAKEYLEDIRKDDYITLGVKGGGCSGFEYGFSFEPDGKQDDDLEFETNGIKMVCDYMSLQYLRGAVIGWTTSIAGSSFSISNPNATATCGCGSSFAA